MIELGVLVLFPVCMAYAATSDILTMTIPNRLSVLLVGGFIIFAAAVGATPQTIGWHIACGLLVLLVTFAMFSFGWMGGGDAKLAAATAVWVGWASVLDYALMAAVLGGALTLFLLLARSWPLPAMLLSQPWLVRLHDRKTGIPYGVALAAAGLLIYPHTFIWTQAAGA
ncbi:MAG TPA: prepilin peptidase [Beijerinckiaceae bacterium]|jgi:prepilin peptidase CpaA